MSPSTTIRSAVLALPFVVAACGGGGEGGGADALAAGDAAGDGFVSLVTADWSLASTEEQYLCVRKTVTEDTWVDAFRGIDPPGTHHNVVGIQTNGLPDATFACGPFDVGTRMLYAEGLGSEGITMPPGVAIKINAGEQVLLNLHVFNLDDGALTGTSGVEMHTVAEADVVHEAEVILAGKTVGLEVPEGASTQRGTCTMAGDVSVFAVFPHMHQLGVHMTTTVEPVTGEPFTLLDVPYDFEAQRYTPLSPIVELREGDRLQVDCGYQNDTGGTVLVGESSDEEMCFTGVYRYPRLIADPICTH